MHFLQAVLDDIGINITRHHTVHGGDINNAYCLYSNNEKYFLKINDAKLYPYMFEEEAKGLIVLQKECPLIIPKVIKHGTIQDQQYLLLEWIEPGKPGPLFWDSFGMGLAMLHQKQQPCFGWNNDNYIGSLKQINQQHNSWGTFFTECRIIPLVKMLFDKGVYAKQDMANAESFCSKLHNLFPEEPPALLHGDLWSGNFMVTAVGGAAVYDPAVYCGHREMDIGMSKLFGGFHQHFYDAYNEQYPLAKGWQQRSALTQLYPLLVHAFLFGGHYIKSAKSVIENF